MAISKASRVTEVARHFVVAVDEFNNGRISGLVFHKSQNIPWAFESLMDLVWIIEEISDQIKWPMPALKQRNFKKVLPISRKLVKETDSPTARKGRLFTLKVKLNYRNFASWQGIVACVEKSETKEFKSFLQLTRYITQLLGVKDNGRQQKSGHPIYRISVNDYEERCLEGDFVQITDPERSDFRSVLELAQYLDRMVEQQKSQLGVDPVLEQNVVANEPFGDYSARGRRANFVVRIRFFEHETWQGTVFWRETKQTVNFRSFLELVKLMDMAVVNIGQWTDENGVVSIPD